MPDPIDVNAQTLESLVKEKDLVFIDFWASWCAPCKVFAETYQRAALAYPEISFVKVNVESEADLAATFHIRSIPHLIVFKKGEVVYSEAGNIPEQALKELIAQALSLELK